MDQGPYTKKCCDICIGTESEDAEESYLCLQNARLNPVCPTRFFTFLIQCTARAPQNTEHSGRSCAQAARAPQQDVCKHRPRARSAGDMWICATEAEAQAKRSGTP